MAPRKVCFSSSFLLDKTKRAQRESLSFSFIKHVACFQHLGMPGAVTAEQESLGTPEAARLFQ